MPCPYTIPRLRKLAETRDKRSKPLALAITFTLIAHWVHWSFITYTMLNVVPPRRAPLLIDTLMARERGSVSRLISRISMNSLRSLKHRILMVHPFRLKPLLTPRTNLAR